MTSFSPSGRRREKSQDNRRQKSPRCVVLFNKPFDVLTQFTDQQGRKTLKDYIDIPNIYAAGRLDRDSEGLLLLTNDGKLQHQLADPQHKVAKTYWVQVDGEIDTNAISKLQQGVKYSKCDMSHTYNQIVLDDEARQLLTINTNH